MAFQRAGVLRRATNRPLTEVFSRRGLDVLVAVTLMSLATGLLAFLPAAFSVDSWLALVTGREVWQSGLPHHELLTSLSHGITWIDQQWLAQVSTYGLYRLGGLGLVGLANVALLVLGVAGAVVGARRLGARPRNVLLALPLCLWLIMPSHEVRTQEFVIPLFAATAYLLARDSRTPSRRVYWCLPILVLWANLHGTVTLGALLVALRGVTVAWERRTSLIRSLRPWARPLALMLGGPLSLLATPYGLGILTYYHAMFLGGTVMHAVTEWQPITSVAALAVPFFVTATLAVWCFGRNGSRTTLWEQLALVALAAASIAVIRNLLFFGLFALMVLPLALGGATADGSPMTFPAPARGRGPINALLSATALAALAIAVGVTLTRPSATIELSYQRIPLLRAVQRATRADHSLRVLADVRFADWLLWRDPALSGRIVNDARFELLTGAQMNRLQAAFAVIGPDWEQGARGDRLLVLDRRHDPAATRAFRSEVGSRVLYDDGDRVVILRGAGEAG